MNSIHGYIYVRNHTSYDVCDLRDIIIINNNKKKSLSDII